MIVFFFFFIDYVYGSNLYPCFPKKGRSSSLLFTRERQKSSDVKLCPKWYNTSGNNSADRQIILQEHYYMQKHYYIRKKNLSEKEPYERYSGIIPRLPADRRRERDLVQDRGWTTTQDLTDYFAIGQCTPGLIALNVATFIGSRRKGVAGAIAATLGFVTMPIIIILIIATFLQGFADLPVVQNAFAGIRVCVCVLIVQAVLRLWKKSVVDKVSLCLYIGVFLMTALSGVLPVAVPAAILVITSGILGVIIGGFRDNNDNKKEAEKKS